VPDRDDHDAVPLGLERLRDPSHVRALGLEELRELLAGAGLDDRAEARLPMVMDRWLAGSFPVPGGADEIRRAFTADLGRDSLSLRVREEGRASPSSSPSWYSPGRNQPDWGQKGKMAEPGGLFREWNEETFGRELLNFPGRAVVLFGEPSWSSPCHLTRRALSRLASEFPDALVGLVTASAPGLWQRLRVTVTPTVIVFEAGREVRRVVGLHPDEFWREVLGGQAAGGDAPGAGP
jgi:hypothetical protein